MIRYFNKPWNEVPLAVLETTGPRPGYDRTVEVGIVRFEGGKPVDSFSSRVNPGVPIPADATAIHGISDADVAGSPDLGELFRRPEVTSLLEGAQPLAYNQMFDRWFIPPFGERWEWPWLDCLSLVRHVDRFARGQGRHKLSAVCERHGVKLDAAHSAGADARACGELFYLLAPRVVPAGTTLGGLLARQMRAEAAEFLRFYSWLAEQPPLEEKVSNG